MKEIFKHCSYVEERNGLYIPRRYTDKQIEVFTQMNHPGKGYGLGCAGMTLDFYTDASEISFQCEVLGELTYGRMDHFDVWEDGIFTETIEWDGFKRINYQRRKDKESRITIYFPVLLYLGFSEFQLGNYRVVKEEKPKLLVIGDSITHGLRGSMPSLALVPSLARSLNMDYLNTAVGGEYHRPGLTKNLPKYTPDRILIHLGTNDVNLLDPPQICEKRIIDCYREISECWTGVRTDVITPVWRTEFSNGSKIGEKRFAYTKFVRDQMFAVGEKFGFRVHDGLALSPNARALLADHCHPNDQGFTIYAQNLLPLLKDER